MKASLAAPAKKRHSLEIKSQRDQEKIAQLKLSNNQLMVDILCERQASNKIIDEAMVKAQHLSAEALDMMSKANNMCDEAEAKIIAERNRASARLCEEPAHHSRESVRWGQKQVTHIDKLHREQASLVEELQSKSKKKLRKAREEVMMHSTKLKEQRSIWQKRLAEIDSSLKNRISNKRQLRRNMIQNQLDRTSALESQLMEIIEGLEVMNSELVDEVKAAKKGMREADRLYDKTKEAAAKRLGQLQQEKEEKNQLKDKLTRVLKAQEAQLDKYKSMVKPFQSSKRSLKPEIKIGRRGGASWRLWVTEVCCELLVNGSPPSAIPSTIGTLFAALYGEEPKHIPLVNYVRQCRVLVQIVSETITAMKLAVCTTWAEIFFDATTRRQVPFSAVVISLMGDTPESIDPVIVSSCVVLEDETLETQVDGIVSKVRHAFNHD